MLATAQLVVKGSTAFCRFVFTECNNSSVNKPFSLCNPSRIKAMKKWDRILVFRFLLVIFTRISLTRISNEEAKFVRL